MILFLDMLHLGCSVLNGSNDFASSNPKVYGICIVVGLVRVQEKS